MCTLQLCRLLLLPFARVQVLQHEIRRTTAKSQALEWMEELMLTEVLGKGGFGIVYKGQ